MNRLQAAVLVVAFLGTVSVALIGAAVIKVYQDQQAAEDRLCLVATELYDLEAGIAHKLHVAAPPPPGGCAVP